MNLPRRLLRVRRPLDIDWKDLFFGIRCCLGPDRMDRETVESRTNPEAVACLSARTGLDLVLRALDLPRNSEVLMSAVTVPGMWRVVEENGLVPVPLDLDPGTLAPSAAELDRRLSPRSRVLVVAPLFGIIPDLRRLGAAARRHGLVVVADLAQAPRFSQTDCWDAALFSFGPIKERTALGGGLVVVKDPVLDGRIRRLEAELPSQTNLNHFRRIIRYAALKCLSLPLPYTLLAILLTLTGRDLDAWIGARVRGFGNRDLMRQLRRRPAPALLSLLARRLDPLRRKEGRPSLFNLDPGIPFGLSNYARARLLVSSIPQPLVGREALDHFFDLFPVRSQAPQALVRAMRSNGLDACMKGNLGVVPAPPGRPAAIVARYLLETTVFLPFHREMTEKELQRMARTARSVPEARTWQSEAGPGRGDRRRRPPTPVPDG